jgi:hypothetical protein
MTSIPQKAERAAATGTAPPRQDRPEPFCVVGSAACALPTCGAGAAL